MLSFINGVYCHKIISMIPKYFFHKVNPAHIALGYVTISTWLILGALFMQFLLKIPPCELCLWQRIPHFVVMFGAVTIPLRWTRLTLLIQAKAYFANVALSFYHSGIERKWWPGPSGCTSQDIQNLSIDALYNQLMATEIVKCDEVAWSLFGLSLTNYNFLICLILGISAVYFIRGYDAQSHTRAI